MCYELQSVSSLELEAQTRKETSLEPPPNRRLAGGGRAGEGLARQQKGVARPGGQPDAWHGRGGGTGPGGGRSAAPRHQQVPSVALPWAGCFRKLRLTLASSLPSRLPPPRRFPRPHRSCGHQPHLYVLAVPRHQPEAHQGPPTKLPRVPRVWHRPDHLQQRQEQSNRNHHLQAGAVRGEGAGGRGGSGSRQAGDQTQPPRMSHDSAAASHLLLSFTNVLRSVLQSRCSTAVWQIATINLLHGIFT